jgi:hypothetical protein
VALLVWPKPMPREVRHDRLQAQMDALLADPRLLARTHSDLRSIVAGGVEAATLIDILQVVRHGVRNPVQRPRFVAPCCLQEAVAKVRTLPTRTSA